MNRWRGRAFFVALTAFSAWPQMLLATAPAPGGNHAVDAAGQEQALAQLDSPRPMERADALMDILAHNDPVLRDAALAKVAVSTDRELKAITLRYLFSRPNKSYIFSFDQCGGGPGMSQFQVDADCSNWERSTSNAFPMVIKTVDSQHGSFAIFAPHGSGNGNNGLAAEPGRVIGDRIEFSVNLALYSGGWGSICSGAFKMDGNAEMKGVLSCGRIILSGHFSIM